MNTAQAEFLLQQSSDDILAPLQAKLRKGQSELQVRSALEKTFTPEQCRALLDCAKSRERHSDKFEVASHWLLTSTAAEQASHHLIASWRARSLTERFGDIPLTEIGCGVGGDSVYLSQHFDLTGYESDPARALLCEQNLRTLGGANWTLKNEEANLQALHGGLLYCDPARRSHKRLMSPDEWLPPLPLLFDCISRHDAVIVKVAPGILETDFKRANTKVEVDFLSVRGDLKEALLYLQEGDPNPVLTKRAVMFSGDQTHILESSNHALVFSEPVPGQYILNPDPAILRADLLNTLAEVVEGRGVHPKIGYLLASKPAPPTFASSFLIEETFELDWKTLKKRVRAQSWTEYEYLGRGVPFSQPDLRKKLGTLKRKKGQQSERGSILVYRGDRAYQVVLARRV